MRTERLNDGWQFRPDGPWQIHSFGPFQKELGWLPAQLPGCVHLDLVANGVIADPLKGYGDAGCAWVDHTDWRYRRVLELSRLKSGFRRVLRFGCLDTVCSIWIDGAKVADHDNYFLPFELEITHLEAGSHELEVRFESPFRVGNERRATYFAKEGLPEDTKHFDARCFLRKPLYQFGWDWGPVLPSCGLRESVELLEFESRILSFDVFTEKLEGDRWRVCCKTEVEGSGTLETSFNGSIGHGDFDWTIESPELWWPNGMGHPNLYHVSAQTSGHRITRTVGFRTIELRRQRDAMGEGFTFAVNGVPFFARGANWIPPGVFPLKFEDHLFDTTMQSCSMLASFNLIRIWGGGRYENDFFYDMCDAMGILVWQDFPFACFYTPDEEENREKIRQEAESQVRRIRNHPSVALFCGNNEVHQMHQQKWAGEMPRFFGERIFEEDLREIVAKNAPEIPYIATSPIGEDPSGKPDLGGQTTINIGGWGDQHFWDVWHGRGDWVHYKDAFGRFSSEFGFASAPCPKVFHEAIGDLETLWHHDRTGKTRGTLESLVELHYPKEANELEWMYSSQLNQRDAMRFAIEHFRTCGHCSGSLIWQLNDCWPAQSWSLMDSRQGCKFAFHELKRLYSPYLLAPTLEQNRLILKLIADREKTEEIKAEIQFVGPDGESLLQLEIPIQITPGFHKSLFEPIQVNWTLGDALSLPAGTSGWIHVEVPQEVLDSAVAYSVAIQGMPEAKSWRTIREPKDTAWKTPRVQFIQVESAHKQLQTIDVRVEGLAFEAALVILEGGQVVKASAKGWRPQTLINEVVRSSRPEMGRLGLICHGPGGYHWVVEDLNAEK